MKNKYIFLPLATFELSDGCDNTLLLDVILWAIGSTDVDVWLVTGFNFILILLPTKL